MTKELTPLEALEIMIENGYVSPNVKELKIIETALKRLDNLQQMLYKMNIKHGYEEYLKIIKALEIIKNNFKLVGNCLHAKNEYAKDGYIFVKEIENEKELNAWKEVLL